MWRGVGAGGPAFRGETMNVRLLLVILLVLLLLGTLPLWSYSGSWGYFPSGGLGLLLLIIIIIVLMDGRRLKA